MLFWALSIKHLSRIMGLFIPIFKNVYFGGTDGCLDLKLPLCQPLTVKSLLQSYAKAIFIQLRNNTIHFSKISPCLYLALYYLNELLYLIHCSIEWVPNWKHDVVDSTKCLKLTWVKWIPVFIRNIFCSPKCGVKFYTKSVTINGEFLKKRWERER